MEWRKNRIDILNIKVTMNKLYYALSKMEHAVHLINGKEGVTENYIIIILADFQFAVSLFFTGVFSFAFIHFYFDYIIAIPLILLFATYYSIHAMTTIYIWNGPDKELQQQFAELYIDVFGWTIVGIILIVTSFLFVLAGGFCFIKGIESIWSYQ